MSRLWSVLCALVCMFACVHVMAVDMDSMAQPHRHHKSSSSSRRHANAATSTQAPTNKPSQAGPNNAFCGAQNIPYNDRTHKCCHQSNKVVRKSEHCPRYVPPSSSSSSSQQQVNKRVDSLQHEVDRLRAKEARREAERRREVQERERRERERREQARRMLAERERREREKKEKEREKKKKQQKPKKCGDETFNPATHRCCNCMPARVVPLSSNCPAADSSLSARCGGGDGVMYDPSRHKCCSNPVAVVDLSANCPPPPRQETSRRLLFQMCGEERCCAQRWTCPERCGSRLFDPDYQGCCNGKAYSLETQFCCNGCVYHKGCGYGCCNGQLYRKGVFTCCPVTLSVVMPGACSNQQTPAPTPAPSNSTTAAPTPAPTTAPSENGAGSSPNGGGVGVNGASEEVEGAELSGELANELAELAGGEESEDSLDSE